MKKLVALLLALAMVACLFVGCGGDAETPEDATTVTDENGNAVPPADETNPDDIPDEMTSEDGTYEVAFVTDVGQLKDKSFNQGTYDGVKLYAYENGLSYKYYQPANGDKATDDDRYDAMKAAAENGAKVIVCAGFKQAEALSKAAAEFTNVNFVFIDGWPLGLKNVAPIAFKEEQCGYFAGYAAVMEGYTKLGFCGGGGGDNPACCRYGYGFVQGADAAAKAKGEKIEIKYSWLYGSSFSASPELQTLCNGWYETGTEVIFACGGQMFDSVAAAAAANDAFVIGVDSDQSFDSDTVITSALKGVGAAASWAIGKSYDGSWDEIGDVATSLGVENDAVGLPTATWSLENWSVDEFQALFQSVLKGELVVDDDYANLAATDNVDLQIVE